MISYSFEKTLKIFEEISRVPRKSGHPEKIQEYLISWAKNHNWSVQKDNIGNILITVPATPGYENSPGVILQGHMDMVCEKRPGSDHDFLKDPLTLYRDGEWLKAKDTTLGADNGIAIALALDLMSDPEVTHPPVEILITVDEEIGLIGAQNLDSEFVKGRLLVNLDSEEEGVFTVGCAGGQNTDISLPVVRENVPGDVEALEITIGGLKGGHSGMDINAHRANANVLLARVLYDLNEHQSFRLSGLSGGSAHNAIPRDSRAVIVLNQKERGNVEELLKTISSDISRELLSSEPDFNLSVKVSSEDHALPLDEDSTVQALRLLYSIPHGVRFMSASIQGQVETSTNFATVLLQKDTLEIRTNQRSSQMSRLHDLSRRIKVLGEMNGAHSTIEQGYPAWEPRESSPLVDLFQKVYKDCFGNDPVIEATHAGLECGIIASIYSGLDMISLGPDIRNPHSPDEKLHLPSVGKIHFFVKRIFSSMVALP